VYLTGRADAGVSVKLLTNSLEATDVPAVHGGYAPYRRPCWNTACNCTSCAASLATAAPAA
jgi:phosphatidylserine/phosphatidylglycerophosphate/cardiolipin synthase-like enzyme